jgi:hypothetical protein
MIRIEGRLATYGEVWFDEEVPVNPGVDVLLYKQRPQPIAEHPASAFITLVSDLSGAEASLMAAFGSTNRYKIKRADTKDALEAEFFVEPRPELATFCDFYDAFAQLKKLEPSYRRGLMAAAQAGQLVLTSARRDGVRLVWHAYILQGTTAALLYSASHFRDRPSGDRAALGRANRWLHWRDMLSLRKAGALHYDWGGLFEDETVAEHAGINEFKYNFGGRREVTYNCSVGMTIKGRCFLSVQKMLQRFPRKLR